MVTGFHASSFNAKLMKTFIKEISWIFCRYVYLKMIKEKLYITLMDVILYMCRVATTIVDEIENMSFLSPKLMLLSIFMSSIENHLGDTLELQNKINQQFL